MNFHSKFLKMQKCPKIFIISLKNSKICFISYKNEKNNKKYVSFLPKNFLKSISKKTKK